MQTELGKRVATGVVGGLALLALIIWGGWLGMFALTALLSLGMVYEYSLMVFAMGDAVEKRYALLCASWFAALGMMLLPRGEFEIFIFFFLAYFLYFLATAGRHIAETLTAHFVELSLSIFGFIYLLFLPFFLPKIHGSANGVQWTVVFFLVVFAGDTGAYFAGNKYGRIKLYPAISPKKTREGALGGLGAGYVVALIAKLTFFRAMPWVALLLFPAIVGAVAQAGDFCESFLKRAYNKKDSGSILPGHGGLLDRFDGVVFSLPVMYACIRLFG